MIEHAGRRRNWIVVFAALTVVELLVLWLWQGRSYWDFSDGVYSDSARQWLHGLVPYRDFAAAQPPPVYLAGAGLLWIQDGLGSLRIGLGLVDAATACVAAWCTWRITHRRLPAVIAGLGLPLLPISLHEHAQLTPETLAAPLLLAGAALAALRRRARAAGVLLALAATCKLAFAVPAAAIALVTSYRRTVGVWCALGTMVLYGVAFAVFGGDLWRGMIEAQIQVGRATLHGAVGLLSQAAWNEWPLVLLGAAAVWSLRARDLGPEESELLKTLAAAAAGGLLLAFTVLKKGSYINVLVVAEPPLIVVAVVGGTHLWQESTARRAAVTVLGALMLAQSLSLLVHPSDPWVAKRPGARSGLAETASRSTIDTQLAPARRCPGASAYSGTPYIAFLAGRRMPGYQPDLFIIQNARADARFGHLATADQPRCP